jgi:hypothetical protein
MSKLWIAVWAGVVFVSLCPQCRADEPVAIQQRMVVIGQMGELMPPLQGTTGQLPPTMATRQNRYEPWQNYGVARAGGFVPRVLMFPDGESFFVYDGKPYPWLSMYMRSVTPFFISF